ncbi:MAG: damage-inducible protein CinA [Opitutae bacterium]|nr:damage-inducible protein CinA [Opitutae bacterium]
MFARRNRPMPASNEKQALFPEGSRVIRNPNGTAPGIDLTVARPGRGESRVLALPGVPPEVDEMWRDSVGDTVVRFAGRLRAIRHRAIKCFGVGESQVETMLPDLIRRGRQPLVGINASQATIILRITAEGSTAEEADSSMIPTVETIHACLGNLVFGEGDDELQDAVLRLLDVRNATLATVEQATEGLVAEWLDHASRHANSYLGGLVVRSQESAARVLGVPGEMLDGHAAGSDEAEVMARQCRDRFGADYALAVGRLPSLAPSVREPAIVYFALAGPGGVVTHRHPYTGHPAIREVFCAKTALNFVRLALLATEQE